jgi:hypothetical protein
MQPALLAWLLATFAGAGLADRWPRLLAVVAWLQGHPRPGVYLRQVDVPGVDSKFIEAHRGVLASCWTWPCRPRPSTRTERRGSLRSPLRLPGQAGADSVPSARPGAAQPAGLRGIGRHHAGRGELRGARVAVERVFITENEVNFLAFPPLARAIVLFGAGYGWEALAGAAWLQRCWLHYWGDIDTHGFAILDQLRGHFPHAASLLMDRETLLAHRRTGARSPSPHSTTCSV